MTLRLFYDYFPYDYCVYIHIIADIMQRLSAGKGYDYFTTISAGTLRLLLTSISYRAKARKEMRREPPIVPRRPPCQEESTAPDVCQVKPVPVRASLNVRKRRNPAGLTPSAGAPGAALASDSHTVGVDPPPLALFALLYTLL